MQNKKSGQKPMRYPPTPEGLQVFLEKFRVIWKLFEGVLDILEPTRQIEEFGGRKRVLVYDGQKLTAESSEADFSSFLSGGVRLMRDIEHLFEMCTREDTANTYFDFLSTEIEKVSAPVWESKKAAVMESRASFSSALATKKIVEIVGRYAETRRLLKSVKTLAQAEADMERRRRIQQAKRDRNQKASTRSAELLQSLA